MALLHPMLGDSFNGPPWFSRWSTAKLIGVARSFFAPDGKVMSLVRFQASILTLTCVTMCKHLKHINGWEDIP